MTESEQPKIYIPTETEIATISSYEPGDQLVEYYSAAERLRIGYLATKSEIYQNRIASGPMEYADSATLSYLGMQVVEQLNVLFETDWNGARIFVQARGARRIMTQRSIDQQTGRARAIPLPQKQHIMYGHLKFQGEGYGEFNNYHDPSLYVDKRLRELKFYQATGTEDYVFHTPVVEQTTGVSLIDVAFK